MADLWQGSEVIDALAAHLTMAVTPDWVANGVAIDTRDLVPVIYLSRCPARKSTGMIS